MRQRFVSLYRFWFPVRLRERQNPAAASRPAAKCRRNLPRIPTAAFQANPGLFSPNFLNFPGIRKAPKKENPFIRAPSHPPVPRSRTTAKKCPLPAARTAGDPIPIIRKRDAAVPELVLPNVRTETHVRAKKTDPTAPSETKKIPRNLHLTETSVRTVVPDGKTMFPKTEKDKINVPPNDKIQTQTHFV